jgi:hypothetical protein
MCVCRGGAHLGRIRERPGTRRLHAMNRQEKERDEREAAK